MWGNALFWSLIKVERALELIRRLFLFFLDETYKIYRKCSKMTIEEKHEKGI